MLPSINKNANIFFKLLSRLLNKLFGKYLYVAIMTDFTYAKDNLLTKNSASFLEDPQFRRAYLAGKQTDKDRFLKGVDLEWRVHVLCWSAKYATNLNGDFVELGVRTGFFSKSIMEFVNFEELDKRFLLIDSFRGVIPELLNSDELRRESNNTDSVKVWESVYSQLEKEYQHTPKVEVIKGIVPEVLFGVKFDKIAFISLDLNSALPEKHALEFLWEYIVPGGIIVLDDYGYPGYEAQQAVHNAFAKSKGTHVLCLPTCQGIIVKPNLDCK
ncbi:macrocin-O-methyltransferase TylF [Roseivirga pacifica]|uniref:Macrocin-O-methyltransferase (TylF) n=1 Tax=Roseivirga pacifica TaxID=1267423 RepID=A0A1I0M9Q2_9BACT|nr:macrocin-O-methyltransferase TylF [Roseivirga pacifica]SEV85197.1 Macrocin-O-methyltransferase (TylF) [Roseivirga pacifica]